MNEARLLIADDEAIIRMNLRESLTGLGYLVVGEAADGVSALHLARQLHPDLLILDLKLPRMDGIAVATAVREEQIGPVLLLTAYSGRELVEQATSAGVSGYLLKPVREGDLMPAIEIARK